MKNGIIALRFFLVMTALTGVFYPFLTTTIAKRFWPDKAQGSLIKKDGMVRGSALIAQKFTEEGYFWSRPSATDYNARTSGGSNQGPTNRALKEIFERGKQINLPDDMIFASGSGLDPHISMGVAHSQIDRVARARGLSTAQRDELSRLIAEMIETRDLGFLGEPRLNVLKLNLAMDDLFGQKEPRQ